MLSIEQLQDKAPSSFTICGSLDRSEKYQSINTQEIVHTMMEKGCTLQNAIQAKTKKPEWEGYQKHQLFFDIPGESTDTHKLQVRVVNSHNGSCSLNIYIGIYVFICSNGLVRANGELTKLRVVHSGNQAKNFMEKIDVLVNSLSDTRYIVQKMQASPISIVDQDNFVQYALGLRWKDQKIAFDPLSLLSCYHKEQSDNTVWNVYNRIQENMLKGFSYRDGKKTRKTRKIKSISEDLKINQGLWTYAENLV